MTAASAPSPEDLLVLVPARGGSKRLPRKHLAMLGGRPLLGRTYEAFQASGIQAPCVLSTDDPELAEVGRRLGFEVPFLRPARLATDDTPTLDVVLHAMDWYGAQRGADPAAVMVLQPTTPFRDPSDLRGALRLLHDSPGVDAVVGVRDLHRAPQDLYTARPEGLLRPLASDRGKQSVYTPNGALYLVRCAAVRREQTLFPQAIVALHMNPLADLDIDTAHDLAVARAVEAAGLADTVGEDA